MKKILKCGSTVAFLIGSCGLSRSSDSNGQEAKMLVDLSLAPNANTVVTVSNEGAPVVLRELPPWAKPSDSRLTAMDADYLPTGQVISASQAKDQQVMPMVKERKP